MRTRPRQSRCRQPSVFTDTDGSEVLSQVRIEGPPAGFTLAYGAPEGEGAWVIDRHAATADFLDALATGTATLELLEPAGELQRQLHAADHRDQALETANGDTETSTVDVPVSVAPVNDAPLVSGAVTANATEDGLRARCPRSPMRRTPMSAPRCRSSIFRPPCRTASPTMPRTRRSRSTRPTRLTNLSRRVRRRRCRSLRRLPTVPANHTGDGDLDRSPRAKRLCGRAPDPDNSSGDGAVLLCRHGRCPRTWRRHC